MMVRMDIAVAAVVGTIGGVGIVQSQDPTGILAGIPEWLMPAAMIMVGVLYGYNMYLTNERLKHAPKPLTVEDLAKMEERIAASNKESLTTVATAVQAVGQAVNELSKALADWRLETARDGR